MQYPANPGPRVLYITGTSVGNGADLTEDTLQTYSLPAGTLVNVGDSVRITASGTLGASTDTKAARLRFGGTSIVAPNGATASLTRWAIYAVVTKTGAGTQSYSGVGSIVNASTGGTNAGTLSITDTAAIAILVGGQNSTNSVSGSVTCQHLMVEFVPAP